MGVLYTALIGFGCILHSLPRKGIYILTHTWGFRRCSFRLTGQCEGLSIVERVTEWLYAFFSYVVDTPSDVDVPSVVV